MTPTSINDISIGSEVPEHLSESRTIVQVRESAFDTWTEATEVTAIGRFGTGFTLSRECKIGQLISLRIPLTAGFPVSDKFELPMSVVCLVQQCCEVTVEGRSLYHIGVVFVGKYFPASYDANPLQCYKVCGTDPEGFFKIKEAGEQFKSRRHPRYRIQLEVNLTLIQKSEKAVVRAKGTTRDIGASGVSVVTMLDAKVGDIVKFGCREIEFYSVSVVRNRRNVFGFEDLLHLEFLESKLPIERVMFGPQRDSITL
jgi:hypothetical protein